MTDMAERITFFVAGTPKAQPRPRAFFNRNLGQARVYDAGTAEGWKGAVALAARPHRPAVPLQGPLSVNIAFYLPRPKCLCRVKDPVETIPHTGKPDVDNLSKAVLDALTALGFWGDDGQVCLHGISKHYCSKPGTALYSTPGAQIQIIRMLP